MQSPHEKQTVVCRTNCQQPCQRNNPLGKATNPDECVCQAEVNAASTFLDSVMDLAKTLAQIMVTCGIHECKAKGSIDVITYAFLHYDQYCVCLHKRPKKCLRKDELYQALGKRCMMTAPETHLAYYIIKRGFSAFYYEPDTYDPSMPDRPLYSEECAYIHAAKKTAAYYARQNSLPCEQLLAIENELKIIYRKYCDRLQQLRARKASIDEDCNCCYCAKARGHFVYNRITPKAKVKKSCPHCCPKKPPPKQLTRVTSAKCPKCQRPRRFCTCEKYKFSLEYVHSIWDRNDFQEYVKDQIEPHVVARSEESSFKCYLSGDELIVAGSQDGSKPGSAKGSRRGSPKSSQPVSPRTSQDSAAAAVVEELA